MSCDNEAANALKVKVGSTLEDELQLLQCVPDPNCPDDFPDVFIEEPIDITGWTIEVDIRTTDDDSQLLKEATIGDGLTIVDAVNGQALLEVDTSGWPATGAAYDVKWISTTGKKYYSETVYINLVAGITD